MSDGARRITLRGVRVHNLKGIDLDIPHNSLVVVTGVSGAGKSSLAFDTLYAEGQRRYIDTFSPATRQFLERLERPEADRIEGILPAIGLGQRFPRGSARSTVGTVTEVHEYLASLYARVGRVVCQDCGDEVRPAGPEEVARQIDAWPRGTRYHIAFPLDVRPDSDRKRLAAVLLSEGFTRVVVGDQTVSLDSSPLTDFAPGAVDVVVDRLIRGSEDPNRRLDSIETAFVHGLGRCRVTTLDDRKTFHRDWRCARCGREYLPPSPALFRYHSPLGACPACEGLGQVRDLDLARIVPDPSRSLSQGAIAPWRTPAHRKLQRELLEFAERRGIPIDRPFRLLTKTQVRRIVDGDGSKRFRGIRGFAEDLANRSDSRTSSKLLNRWLGHRVCPTCDGARLKAEARAVQVGGVDIASLCSRTIAEVQSFLADPDRLGCLDGLTRRTLAPLCARLDILRQVGVDDLTLNRPIRTLSRGEFQRVSLSASLSSGLIHTLYVLDEPSTGLHPQEMGPLVEALRSLRNLGNTVVVVDHDPAILQAADWLIDLGPGAGRAGGLVVYQGPPEGVENAPQSRTGRALASESRPPGSRRPTSAENRLVLRGASGRNLKDIDVAFPLRAFCVVTGLSGSGKSSLIQETLYPALVQRLQNKPRAGLPFRELQGTEPLDRVDHLDATPIGRSGRSNPATYLGAYDFIRKTFAETHEAKTRNYRAGRFSFNVPGGRCEACQGQGFQTIDMRFLSDVVVRCPECRGTRFRQETLDVTYRGKSIAEVLDLTIRDAFGFFRNRHKIQSRLQPALEIGLDYLVLGQPAATLSAGEAQRLKIARFLADSLAALRRNTQEARSLLILDEPTRGLHPDDVRNLLIGLDALVDRGHSLIVIEHDPMVMAHADWIIDLGPAAGPRGGQVIAQGTPEQVAKSGTPTGLVLRRVLGIPDGEP